jgi:hypothetical protein
MNPPPYRNWRLVSLAHEAGELNDIHAILGNDVAIKSYREGKLRFPDGAMIARAWNYVASEGTKCTFCPAGPSTTAVILPTTSRPSYKRTTIVEPTWICFLTQFVLSEECYLRFS